MKTGSKTIDDDNLGGDSGSITRHRPPVVLVVLVVLVVTGAWIGGVQAGDRVDLFGNDRFATQTGIFFTGYAPNDKELQEWVSPGGGIGSEQGQDLQADFGSGEVMEPRIRVKPRPILGEPPVLEPPPVPEPGSAVLTLMCLAARLLRRHRPDRV
jgi:hypothetical protein